MTFATHELKVWPEFFGPIIEGRKTFEVRKDDRGFQQGDRLYLREYNPYTHTYTTDSAHRRIVYILRNVTGLQDGYVVLGMGPL